MAAGRIRGNYAVFFTDAERQDQSKLKPVMPSETVHCCQTLAQNDWVLYCDYLIVPQLYI